jgi:hypothetical protein
MLDDELEKVTKEYDTSRLNCAQGLKLLKRRIKDWEEPESSAILAEKIEKEKEYL